MIYGARESAISILNQRANEIGADKVVGVRTYVYQLGNGLIEFLAIGTAMKKVEGLSTKSEELIPQAFVKDQDTFINTMDFDISSGEDSSYASGTTNAQAGAAVDGMGVL
jgi:Putative heavy-metal-binding